MIKIWKSGNHLSGVGDIGKARNKQIKGYILLNEAISNKALIDDIINATDGFEVTMFTYRTRHRILYSNDGLVFVTYDHYETFHEIV